MNGHEEARTGVGIIKIREWVDADEPEPKDGWGWPHPPVCIESRIDGDLRDRILSKLGRSVDDAGEVRIVEREIEGGWSEFTVETDYDIEVWIHEGRQAQRVWEANDYDNGRTMAAFLRWVG